MRRNLKTYVVLGLTLGTVLTSASIAFAAAGGENTDMGQARENGFKIKMERSEAGSGNVSVRNTKADFSKFVEEGIISQDTADKITAYMEEQWSLRSAEAQSMKDMTEDERSAYLENKKTETLDLYTRLVDEGILTRDEADALKAAMPERMPERTREHRADFSRLVEEGVISQETAEKMTAYTQEKWSARRAETLKINDMTEEEKAAYLESKKNEKIDIITEMVNEGILTQDEADAIQSAMPMQKKRCQ